MKDLREKVLNLINEGVIEKVILKDDKTDDIGIIKKITNRSYFDFKKPLKVKNPSRNKNLIFGCGIDILDLEKTLKLNNIEVDANAN